MKMNHSRYLDYGARHVGNRAYESAKSTPTHKQKKFYNQLFAMCKEHEVDTDVGFYTRTRADYALAIDRLIKRLQEKGVDVKGNGKNAGLMLIHAADSGGYYSTRERIIITDEESRAEINLCRDCKYYYATSDSGGDCEKYELHRDGDLTCTDWEGRL